jgi:capsular polysaccharide biosynthesis protein
MCEVLPRLWAAEAAPSLMSVPVLVNDGALAPFQQQTLLAAGAVKAVPFSWRCARFKRLYLPSFLSSGEVARRLRPWFARLRLLLGGGSSAGPRRLYVSREDAQRRRMSNDAEVAAALRPLGFERVTLEARSVAEQLDLFAGAEAIVLPHGAAGANLPAAPAGALLVECHSARLLNPCYWLMARAMDLAYGFVADGEGTEGVDYAADLTVNPQKLLRVLEAGLAAR